MTTDPRALIEEGRKHDEAMRRLWPLEGQISVGQVEWSLTNLAALLTGYASALDEVEHQKSLRNRDTIEAITENGVLRYELAAARTSIGELKLVIEQQDKNYLDIADALLPSSTGPGDLVAEARRLRADLAAARDMNRHFEQERDAWPEAYKQRATRTDARIKELETGLREALSLADVPERNQDDEWYAHCESLNAILNPTGAPCTTK